MKKLFTLVGCIVYNCSLFSQIPTTGLIGGWPFTGNANDISGSGNHGSVVGATLTADRFNSANCAYHFNGSTDYIQMLTAGPTGSVSRSVSFWMRSTNTVTDPVVGFGYGGPSSAGGIFQINFNYNCQGVGFDNSQAAAIRHGIGVNNGQWHHIVAVLNATAGIQVSDVQIWVDAVLQTSVTCFVSNLTSSISSNAVFPINVGKTANASDRYFSGDLDDFYLYNRVLSSAEIAQLYNYLPCNGPPVAPSAIMGNSLACAGTAHAYSIAPVNGATSYTWNLPAAWTGSSSSATITPVTTPYAGTIAVAARNSCGQSPFTVMHVTISPGPLLNLSVQNQTVCFGGTAILQVSGASGYTWNTGSNSATIQVSPPGTTNYSVVGTDGVCSSTAAAVVYVGLTSTIAIAVAGATTSCSGQHVSLASNGALTYTWQPGNLNGFLVTVNPVVTTVYTVSGTDGYGCIGTRTYTQFVTPLPLVVVSVESQTICANGTASLSATGAGSYIWQPGFYNTSAISVGPAVSTQFTVTGTSLAGCSNTALAQVYVSECAGIGTNVPDSQIKIFPNPFTDYLEFSYDRAAGNIVIYDAYGHEVLRAAFDQGHTLFDCRSLNAGMYVIQVNTHAGRYCLRVVKD